MKWIDFKARLLRTLPTSLIARRRLAVLIRKNCFIKKNSLICFEKYLIILHVNSLFLVHLFTDNILLIIEKGFDFRLDHKNVNFGNFFEFGRTQLSRKKYINENPSDAKESVWMRRKKGMTGITLYWVCLWRAFRCTVQKYVAIFRGVGVGRGVCVEISHRTACCCQKFWNPGKIRNATEVSLCPKPFEIQPVINFEKNYFKLKKYLCCVLFWLHNLNQRCPINPGLGNDRPAKHFNLAHELHLKFSK